MSEVGDSEVKKEEVKEAGKGHSSHDKRVSLVINPEDAFSDSRSSAPENDNKQTSKTTERHTPAKETSELVVSARNSVDDELFGEDIEELDEDYLEEEEDELGEYEYEEVPDEFPIESEDGEIKYVSRKVKKRKSVSLPSQGSKESVATVEQQTDADEWELVEEEIEEEIEVEEEEEEIEDEEEYDEREEDEGAEEGEGEEGLPTGEVHEKEEGLVEEDEEEMGEEKEEAEEEEGEMEEKELVPEVTTEEEGEAEEMEEGEGLEEGEGEIEEGEMAAAKRKEVKGKKKRFKTIKIRKTIRRKKKREEQWMFEKSLEGEKEVESVTSIHLLKTRSSTETVIFSDDLAEAIDGGVFYTERERRDRLIEQVKLKTQELQCAKRRNKYLTKAAFEYYRGKKMEYVYQEETPTEENMNRYLKRLKMYEELKQATNAEQTRKLNEINALKEDLDELNNKWKTELTSLINKELEVGKSVIDSSTGKPISEEFLRQLIQRQELVMTQTSQMRLQLIKLQNHLAGKEAALKSLDFLGGNLHLIDYEQLRMDNQNLADKIEERDEELSRLRQKVLAAIQTLAHVREKSDAIYDDIETYNMNLDEVDCKMQVVREKVNKLKQKRDSLREEARKMKKDAGLLLRPRLALDMEYTIQKVKEDKEHLEGIIKIFNTQKSTIARLRKQIDDSISF